MFGIGRLGHYMAVAREALREERAQAKKPTLRKDERELQAAAIEILETPASPTARLFASSLMLLFVAGLIWSIIGRLDVHAVLEGKVVPVGQVKVIEPLITGTVKTIHARQGQEVAAGDLLITLDPTEPAADLARLEDDLITSTAVAARLTTAIDAAETANVAPMSGCPLSQAPLSPSSTCRRTCCARRSLPSAPSRTRLPPTGRRSARNCAASNAPSPSARS
jgi:hemolysin D